MWENSLEKLKILNYEKEYCKKLNKKACNRVHFVIPGVNASHQFDDFIGICAWLFALIGGSNVPAASTKGKSGRNPNSTELFRPEEFDDPNTVVNKLLLALRQVDFRSSFPQQKLKAAHGEPACTVLDFLTDKALTTVGFQWGVPIYSNNIDVEQAEPDDDANDDDIAEDEELGGPDDDVMFEDPSKLEVSIDSSNHNILQALVDPVEWKTELERVGPKLRTNQQLSTNEWRAHVDQTVSSKVQIEKVLGDTQGDLQAMNKNVSSELNHMRMKEKYLNNQYNTLGLEFIEVKHRLEELETRTGSSHEAVAKLTNELAELTEKLEELKESFESRDSGLHDTSPLVKIKAALQQIKKEIHFFDMRIGVVSHSLLAAKVSDTNRLRSIASVKARQRHNKNKKASDDNSLLSDDD